MAAQLELQNCPTNHHQAQSRSSSTPEISSSLPTSSSTTRIQPSPITTPINALHYSMLINGDTGALWNEFDQDFDFSNLVSESDNSNILHFAASTGPANIVSIINRSPNLLLQKNSKGDLPIHIAARACQIDAVIGLTSCNVTLQDYDEVLILMSKNHDDNTALHIALENQQKIMAEYLFQKCPKTFYVFNKKGFSPLYLAIKAEFWDLVKDMLSEGIASSEAEGQLSVAGAKSVVHAAIIAKQIVIFDLMLQTYSDLVLYKTDEQGRTPLSLAAFTGFLNGVKSIINAKDSRNQVYKIDDNGFFPIHWACSGGYVKIVEEFFSDCLPKNMRLMLSAKGQNILHVAAASGKAEVVKYILRRPELETMINMKDEDGNTPLHLASKGKHPKVVYDFTWDDRVKLNLQNKAGLTALDIAEDCGDQVPSFEERLTWLSLRNAGVQRSPHLHNLNVYIIEQDMAWNSPSNTLPHVHNYAPTTFMMVHDQQGNLIRNYPIKKRKHKYKERINTLLLVATLVATITFASGFTVPGGYNNDSPNVGMATLAHKCAFQVFVISNTIAMYSAILTAVTLIWAQLDDVRLVLVSLDFALPLLGTSLATMSVAFMAGLYVVLHSVVFWLGLVVILMGGVFLSALLVFFIPLYSPRFCIRNKILRDIFHVPFTLMLLACEKGKSGKHY